LEGPSRPDVPAAAIVRYGRLHYLRFGEEIMKALRISLGILFVLLVTAMTPLSAKEQKSIFYNVTTDEAWKAGMALAQANGALKKGYKIIIHLNTRAVFIASKSFASDVNGLSGKSLQDMLKAMMDKGAQVLMCPMCTKKAGLTKDDLMEGVIMGGPDVTLKAMTADDTTVISY